MLGDGDRVGRLIAADELRDRAEDQPMVGPVEVLAVDDVRDLVPGALVQHQPAEQRLLGLDRVRRQAELVRGRERRISALTLVRPLASRSADLEATRPYWAASCSSDSTTTVTSTFTSACRCSSTLCSPTTRNGPS